MSYRVISYVGYQVTSGMDYSLMDVVIWGYMSPTSTIDMTLRATPNTTGIAALVSAVHAVNKKIIFQLYAPWSQPDYNNIFTDTTLRDNLFSEIQAAITAYGFDGVNFDWECDNNGPPYADDANVTAFYAALYTILNPLGKTISATENYGSVTMTSGATAYLDWIGLMVYDYPPTAWYGTLANVSTEMARWSNAGFTKSKLILGINFAARLNGSMSSWVAYSWIIDTYNPDTNLNVVDAYFYNGADLVTDKVKWVKANGYGGVFSYDTQRDKIGNAKSLFTRLVTGLNSYSASVKLGIKVNSLRRISIIRAGLIRLGVKIAPLKIPPKVYTFRAPIKLGIKISPQRRVALTRGSSVRTGLKVSASGPMSLVAAIGSVTQRLKVYANSHAKLKRFAKALRLKLE